MKSSAQTLQRRVLVSAVTMALAGVMSAQIPAMAQSTLDSGGAKTAANALKKKDKSKKGSNNGATQMKAVVVKGIVSSLEQSMNIKRFSNGIVDGIVAEDIGKFPDTNLAEALQRIPGVSIDRVNGEGSRVTVRGIGPQFNLVLLNGRLMPTANIQATGASVDRSFDFAQLSSTAVSEVDVYKTGDASTPPGGMGATINIVTARPFDNPGTHGALTVQGVYDTSRNHLPSSLKMGSMVTPRINGIFSTTTDDGKFGFGINASYEKRTFGANVASTGGWRSFKGDEVNWGTIPLPGQPGSQNITNRPGPNDTYSVPQSLAYDVNGNQSTRVNGQVVFQYKPTENLTTTLDYTYSEYKIQHQYNELSAWFNFGPSKSVWTNGPVAAPLIYEEFIGPPGADIAMAGGQDSSKETLHSVGFNTKWKATENLSFTLDAHHSTAENGPDGPYGNSAVLGTAAFIRGNTTANFNGRFPILTTQYLSSNGKLDPSQVLVTGSSFRNSYMKSTVDQVQLNGSYVLPDESELDFGVASTDVKNRTAFSNVQMDTWGGATSAADYPNSVWHLDHMGQYFNQFSGNNSPAFSDAFYTFNFNQVRQLALQAWHAAGHTGNPYTINPNYTTDMRTQEKSKSAFLSWDQTYYPWNMPLRLSAGVRYEKTDVTSSALVPNATGISWGSNNEFTVLESGSGFTTLRGSYKYFLPAFNASLNVTDDMKLRAAYSETIGRPNWGDIQGGQTLNPLVRVNGGTGSQGNPGLKPLLSHNIDLSWAWYYSKGSYVSVDFFRKNIDNYVGTTQVVETPFNLHTPVGGAYWNAAVSAGCASSDTGCIRQYIFSNFAGQPGVNVTGTDSTGALTGTIVGQPGDPLTPFRISTPANSKSTSLHGWEFAFQQMLWDTGFGVSANYTIVESPLTYDNQNLGQQFVLTGLSNSGNFVGFYQKGPWQFRAAYNWRGKFLASAFDSTGPNPIYNDPYGQWDASASYDVNKQFSITLDAINITNRTQYLYSRNHHQLEYATQTGSRYMLGVRYKFH